MIKIFDYYFSDVQFARWVTMITKIAWFIYKEEGKNESLDEFAQQIFHCTTATPQRDGTLILSMRYKSYPEFMMSVSENDWNHACKEKEKERADVN